MENEKRIHGKKGCIAHKIERWNGKNHDIYSWNLCVKAQCPHQDYCTTRESAIRFLQKEEK